MANTEIKLQMPDMKAFDIARRNFPQIAFRALKRTIEQGRTQAIKEITSQYNVKASEVRSAIATRVDDVTMTARLIVSGRKLPLSEFAPEQTPAGVAFQIKKGARSTMRHAFLATMSSGHKGVFQRIGGKGWSKSRPMPKKAGFTSLPGLPIAQKVGLSIARMFNKSVRQRVNDFVRVKLPEEAKAQLRYFAWKKS